MTYMEETLELEVCPNEWAVAATKNVAVNHLMDRMSPCFVADDVDRAILGASMGG